MAEDHIDARTAALTGLFDDAAMFPPASRDLADALASHRGHVSGERSWLVRRLLVRASDAGQVTGHMESDDDLEMGAVLDRAGGGTFADGVAADIVGLSALARDPRVRLTDLEVRLDAKDPEEEVAAILAALQGARLPQPIQVAVEVPVNGRPAGDVLRGLQAVADARRTGGQVAAGLVAKVRCGGTALADVPIDLELAGFLRACAKLRLPFKATAGLHHPTRTTNPDHGAVEHGFLNLLAASVAAYQGARLDAIEEHLGRGAEQFKLGPGALVVGEEVVEAADLGRVRRDFFQGIGCCDVLDPVTDLARMGVVTPTGGLA